MPMFRQINELYEDALKAGKKVSEIIISYIGYDHLKSELNNRKEKPEWMDRVKATDNVRGIQLIAENDREKR